MQRAMDRRSAVALRRLVPAFMLGAFLSTGSEVHAQGSQLYTAVQDGSWDDPAVWDLLGWPDSNDFAYVDYDIHVDSPGNSLQQLMLRSGCDGGQLIVVPGGSLQVVNTYIGVDKSCGTMIHTGGSSTHQLLSIGDEDTGSLFLHGGDLQAQDVFMSVSAWNPLNPSGLSVVGGAGTFSVTGTFDIGSLATLFLRPSEDGSAGLTTLAAGDLTIASGASLRVDPDYPAEVGHSWDILTYTGTLTGMFTGVVTQGQAFTLALDTSTPGVVRVAVTDSVYPLPGDTCMNAIPIDIGESEVGNMAFAGFEDSTSNCLPIVSSDLFYAVQNSGSEPLCVQAVLGDDSTFQAFALEIFDGCAGSVLACANGTGSSSAAPLTVSWVAQASSTSWIRIAWQGVGRKTFPLTVSLDGGWVDVGGGGDPGVNGVPALVGTGVLHAGETAGVSLGSAPGSTLALAWLSLGPSPFPALGGTVHAFPTLSQFLFVTDPAGQVDVATTWPPGIPPATDLWIQFICEDASAPAGLTLSNAVKGTTPGG